MLQRSFRCLLLKTLANGTVLDGTFDDATGNLVAGITKLPDGRVFKGKFDATTGFPLPQTQLEEDGDLYVGEFNSSWQRHGQGKAWLLDGTEYDGTFADDELVKGKVTIPSGGTSTTVFTGTLENEQFIEGTLQTPEYSYVGTFKDNSPHGSGTLKFASSAYQKGTFFKGRLHGTGNIVKLENGNLYIGDFVEGTIRRGELRTPAYLYEGEFDDVGYPHGSGRKEDLTSHPKLIYSGRFSHGQMVEGVCHDEFGEPVDQLMESRIREKKGVKDNGLGSLLHSMVKDFATREREEEESYHKDASKAYEETGRLPLRHELGYSDEGPASGDTRQQADENEPFARQNEYRSKFETARQEMEAARAAVQKDIKDEGVFLNPEQADQDMRNHHSAQTIVSNRIGAQYERFKAQQQKNESAGGNEAFRTSGM